MPTYPFRCRQCGIEFEVFLSIKEKETKGPVCTSCGSGDLVRLYSNVNVNTKTTQSCPHHGCEAMQSGCCPRMGCGQDL
ncbi:MAG: Zinc ribbon domain protein [Firmicutes bacterium ADurb.Bin182]|nr:MAG: Zinc ribbon domain protein [Firmicutes bacterium ADurb.Bin182]